MLHVSKVTILITAGIFLAQLAKANTCPCMDSTGSAFGYLKCESSQVGYCKVQSGQITSWCKTPPTSSGASWLEQELNKSGNGVKGVIEISKGVFLLSPGETISVSPNRELNEFLRYLEGRTKSIPSRTQQDQDLILKFKRESGLNYDQTLDNRGRLQGVNRCLDNCMTRNQCNTHSNSELEKANCKLICSGQC